MNKVLASGIGSLAVGLGLVLLPGLALAVGSNGSFETGIANPGTFTTLTSGDTTSITGWSVDSGSVDYIGTYWPSSDGVRNIDLNGNATGAVSETFATVIGATYTVTFDLSGNPDSSGNPTFTSPNLKDVLVSGTGGTPTHFTYDTSVKGNSLANMMWESHLYSFVATGVSSTLSFASAIPGAFGPAIDNVVINETLPPTSSISGEKYNDLNRNGKKDAGEPGLPGWTIKLETKNGTVITSTVTGAGGLYTFPNLPDGTYKLREVHQNGWKRMSKNPKPIVITAGSVVTDVDFGNAVKKKGEKEDTDQDCQRDDQSGTYYAHHGHNDYGHNN